MLWGMWRGLSQHTGRKPAAWSRRTLVALAAVTGAFAAAGCGDSAGAARTAASSADTALAISYSDGSRTLRATLRCTAASRRATGFLAKRNVRRLCDRVRGMRRVLVEPRPADRICTQIYGGPDRALVKGRLRGAAVSRRFGRADGCQIADWDAAQQILPRPSGAW